MKYACENVKLRHFGKKTPHFGKITAFTAALDGLSTVPNNTYMLCQFVFHPIAVETQHGPLNESACVLLSDVGRHIALCSGDDRKNSFLKLVAPLPNVA